MIYSKLLTVLKQKKITQEELANAVNMSRGGLMTAFENETIQVRKLLEISKFLSIDNSYWFDGDKKSLTTTEKKLIESLREFIAKEI